MRESISELDLEARIGIEAGEVVVEDSESTFVTGEAVNLAARLQQAARPGEILVGPTAYRLAAASLVAEEAGPLDLKGVADPLRAWRVQDALDGRGRPLGPRAPLVGRESELELLENTFARTVRDRRAYLFTIYGEPGIGKSRLAREFLDGVERASSLIGRALPYGEGVTYWPLAEMVKAAAGISDDDPLEEAFEKLRECCAEETVADVLGLASGMLEALEGERSPQEISWAARELVDSIADVQPLVLLFEDIHWAEEPLLDLIEHLADRVRAPVLILCLARPELLDERPGWGGGRVRSTAIELEPLSEEESELLVEKLLAQLAGAAGETLPTLPKEVLERTEGNPLFVEETIRMLVESDSGNGAGDRVPDTLQALIAARIDHLSPPAKTLLQRASVVGRVFWKGALEHLSPNLDGVDDLLDDLVLREFVLREVRSSISGEVAYRFKHLLIREVAYTGLAKLARAQHHARFAEWLAERTGEELVEIRAYHLDQAVEFLTELEGAPPEALAEDAAALVKAAKRASAREAYANARALGLRALELGGESGSLRARTGATLAYAWFLLVKGEHDAAESLLEEVRKTSAELGAEPAVATALAKLGWIARWRGDHKRAEKLLREAYRIVTSRGDRGPLSEMQAALAMTLTDVRKIDEAEQLALDARANAGPEDVSARVESMEALGAVRAAQGRDGEAEDLVLCAIALARESEFKVLEIEPLGRLAGFLRERGRDDEAVPYESRLAELAVPSPSTARIA